MTRTPLFHRNFHISLLTAFTAATLGTSASAEELNLWVESAPDLEAQLVKALKSPEAACQFDYLKSLGWRVIESKTGFPEIIDGQPCDRPTIEASQKAGELVIALPRQASGAQLAEVASLIPELVKKNMATVCAYKQKVAIATRNAIQKLQANPNYKFSRQGEEQDGFVEMGTFGGLELGWIPTKPFTGGLAYRPYRSNSWAIESFYTQSVRTECAAGLQLAEHAIQYELYGKADYNRVFKRGEILIGTWNNAVASYSAIHGQNRGRVITDRNGANSVLLGGQALVGRTGYLGNVKGEAFLDTKSDRGENLLIVSVSEEASREMLSSNGFDKYNKMMYRIWELYTENKTLWKSKATADVTKRWANQAEIEEILKNPFFTGIQTYTHPFKVLKTFKDQIQRLLNINPRTPYEMSGLYEDVINYGLYDRHANYFIGRCMKKRSN
jgi:hypothetical protein